MGYILEDPLLDGWLHDVGQRLSASSDRPQQSFTFFLLRDRQINAFATLGGYIGMNAGLILSAEREDEMAGVLAHEIAHVTQQHVLRGAEKAQRDSLPILLAMLGAIVAAQQAGGNSSGDATSAAVMAGLGLLQQRQIDYTRDNEAEADRVGIRTLSRSGYDPEAMADFFQTMQATVRMNQGDERARVPELPADPPGHPDPRQRGPRAGDETGAADRREHHHRRQQPAAAAGLSIATTTGAATRGQGCDRRLRLGARAPARAQRRRPGAGDPRVPADARQANRWTMPAATAWRSPTSGPASAAKPLQELDPAGGRPSRATCGCRWRMAEAEAAHG